MRIAWVLCLASWAAADDRIERLMAADVQARRAAAAALAEVPGEAVVEALREALLDDDLVVRANAARSLGAHGPAAAAAVADLNRAADDAIDAVRGAALVALARIGDAGVPLLLERVRDPATRAATFAALAAQEAEAYPAVLVLLDQPSWHVRYWTLKRVRPAHPVPDAYVDAVARLVAEDPSEAVRHAAAHRLCTANPQRAVPHLRRALRSPDPLVRVAGAAGLAHAERDAGTVAALAEAVADPQPAVAVRAALALHTVGDHREAALPALRAALRSIDPRTRTAAASALAALGETSDDSIPLLLAAVRAHGAPSPYPDRYRNLRAGGGLGLAPPDPLTAAVEQVLALGDRAIQLLAPLVAKGEAEERVRVLFALARLGAKDAVRGGLDAEEPDVRRVAAACLVWMGATDAAPLRELASHFGEHELRTAEGVSPEAAADLLEKAGAAAVPVLLERARAEFKRENPAGPVRDGASVMISVPAVFQDVLDLCLRIGAPAVPALEAAQGDPAVGDLAAEALRQIRATAPTGPGGR